jgi:sugar phosphate isomerase/epimerase
LRDLIALGGAWGYEAVEFPAQAALTASFAGELKELSHLCRELLVEPYACSGAIPLDDVRPADLMCEDASFAAALGTMEDRLGAARELGARIATVSLGPATPPAGLESGRATACERLARVCDVARRCGLAVAVEFTTARATPSRPRLYDSIAEFLQLLATADPETHVVADTWHWTNLGASWDDLKLLRDSRIALMHISDFPAFARPPLADSRRLLPGEGVLDIGAIMRATEQAAVTSIEVFSDDLRAMSPGAICAKLHRAWLAVTS